MTSAQARRASPAGRIWLAAVVFAACLLAAPASAQVEPDTLPRDTLRADTVLVPIPPAEVEPDTLPADSLASEDSLVVVPVFPHFPDARPEGWAYSRWEWNRDDLLRFHGLSVLELVEQIPGMVVTRSGDFGSPAGISALGMGGARVRVFLDGFEIDPLGFTTPDLQQFGLVDLETVRVERTPNEIRVDLIPVRMSDPHPYSLLEAGTGTYEIKLLRGLLMRGIGAHSIVTGAYDLVSTHGFGFDTPYALTAGRLSWSYALGDKTALQLEYRGTGTRRSLNSYPLDASRKLFLLRGRSEISPGLTLDAMLGRASRSPDTSDPLTTGLASTQTALRAGYLFGRGSAEASVRARSGSLESVAAPGLEFSGRGNLGLLPWLNASAELTEASLGGQADLQWNGTVRAGYASGLAAYATIAAGERGLGLVSDTTRYVPLPDADDADDVEPQDTLVEPYFSVTSTGVGAARLGAEWVHGDARLGVAAVTMSAGRVVPFGLAFDRGLAPVEVGSARGFEASGDVPVPLTRGALRLDGWYSFWSERGDRPYLPDQQGSLALVYHDLYYDSELEPTLRIEVEHRGTTLAPAADSTGFSATTLPYSLLNLSLQIRILDLRAFIVWDNVLDYRSAVVIPGQRPPGMRMYYGIRWVFHD